VTIVILEEVNLSRRMMKEVVIVKRSINLAIIREIEVIGVAEQRKSDSSKGQAKTFVMNSTLI